MPRPSGRKRQQRLAFTPIPSSSPAAKGYHKQIQDRAAAVRLEISPTSIMRKQPRAVPDDSINLVSDDEVPIPSPAASLKLDARTRHQDTASSSSDSEPVRLTQRPGSTTRKRTRQQRLDFNNAREPSSFDSPLRLSSSAHTRSSNKPGIFSSQVQGRIGRYDDDDEGDSGEGSESLPSPREMLKATKRQKSSAGKPGYDTHKDGTARSSPTTAVDNDDDDEIVVAESRAQKPPEQDLEDSGDDTDMPTTQRKQRRKLIATKAVSVLPGRVVGDNDDEDEMPTTQGKLRRTKRVPRNSFISDSPPPASDSDDDIQIVGSRRRGREASSSEEEEDALPKTPGRRGLKQRSRQLSQREKEDLNEDLDFLGPSSDNAPSSDRRQRNTLSAQKTAKQQALERLKRARAGQEVGAHEEEVDDDDEPEYEEDEDAAADYTSSYRLFREQEGDADFIEVRYGYPFERHQS